MSRVHETHQDIVYHGIPTIDGCTGPRPLTVGETENNEGKKTKTKSKSGCCSCLRNKCCIACLVFIALVFLVIVGVATYVYMLTASTGGTYYPEYYSPPTNGTDGNEQGKPVKPVKPVIDLATWEAPKYIADEIFYYRSGSDKEGIPVWIMTFGRWDLKKILTEGESEEDNARRYFELCTVMDQLYFRVTQSMNEANKTSWVAIQDMKDYGIGQVMSMPTTRFYIHMAKTFLPFIQVAEYGWFINMNYGARMFLNIIRPIWGTALDKFENFGFEKDEYIASIHKRVNPDQLPQLFGGTQPSNPRHLD